jgi:hypothetical protein
MATTSFAHTPNVNAGAAAFNTYFGLIRSTLLSFGWVQTSDTGQVDLAVNATIPAIGTHYQVFRMNDALQATSPVFLRLGYGNSSGIAQLNIWVGKATDGAGNMVGDSTTATTIQNNNLSGTTTPMVTFASGNTNRVWMALCASTALFAVSNHLYFFAVERSKDAAGADTGDFVTLLMSGGADTIRQQSLHYSFGPTAVENRWVVPVLYTSSNLGFGSSGGTMPVFPMLGRLESPMMDVGVCKANDFIHTNTYVANSYGLARTFKCFDGGINNSNFSTQQIATTLSTTQRYAIFGRWE